MDGGATRVSVLRTTVPFWCVVALCRRKGWFVFFICFVWLRRWWILWCVVGCLSVVVWFSWVSDYLICLISWLWWRLCLLATYVVMDRPRRWWRIISRFDYELIWFQWIFGCVGLWYFMVVFLVVLIWVFCGGARGGFWWWCLWWFWVVLRMVAGVAFRWGLMVIFVVVNDSFGDGGGNGVVFCGGVCGGFGDGTRIFGWLLRLFMSCVLGEGA